MDIRARERAEPFTTKDGSTIRELMHAANQTLAEATLEPGQQTQRHYHAAEEADQTHDEERPDADCVHLNENVVRVMRRTENIAERAPG
jgi:hypothetical protein